MEARYNRVLACSLNAYAAFWDELATSPVSTRDENQQMGSDNWHEYQMTRWKQLNTYIEKTAEIQNSILNDGKFWKFSQSKDYAVSIYQLFSAWHCNLMDGAHCPGMRAA